MKTMKTMKTAVRTRQFIIKDSHPLFEYIDNLSFNCKNLYNTSNFYIRQLMSGLQKDASVRCDNEKEVISIVESSLDEINDIRKKSAINHKKSFVPFEMPTSDKWMMSYHLLEGVLKVSKNADYLSLPSQCNQAIIKQAILDWKSYFASMRDYKKHPEKYNGMPKLPHYANKNGRKTCFLSNQICKVVYDENTSKHYIKFPKTHLMYCIGESGISWDSRNKLKQVRIVPMPNRLYAIELVYEKPQNLITDKDESTKNEGITEKIAAIDLGVNNIVTMVDNIGNRGNRRSKPMIIKGNIIKSRNQWYNRQRSHYYSILTKGRKASEHTTYCTRRLNNLDIKRNLFMKDQFHKISRIIVNECVHRDIDTLVIGINHEWKDNVSMRKSQKQTFIQIPFAQLISMIRYKAEEYGIEVIETEESYTSKASFLDNDEMPIYSKSNKCDNSDKHGFSGFSGRRIKRGLYRTSDGTVMNADVNGAFNILRKVFPTKISIDVVRDSGGLDSPVVSTVA